MLRTASTRTTTRTPRATTGVRHEWLLDSTPVLMKLPVLDHVRAVPGAPDVDSGPELTAIESARSERGSHAPMAGAAVSAAKEVPVATEPYSVELQPEPVVRATPAARTEPDVVAEPEELRSWWEHWTSGVVLILLILALLVATLMALKKPRSSGELLADDTITKDDLAIPTLELPAETSLASGHTEAAINGTAALTAAQSTMVAEGPTQLAGDPTKLATQALRAELDGASGNLGASLVPGEFELDLSASNNELNLSESASAPALQTPVSLLSSLGGSTSESSPELTLGIDGASTAPPPTSTATLSPPIGIEQPRLFDDQQLQFDELLPVSPVANQSIAPTTPLPSDEAMAAPRITTDGLAGPGMGAVETDISTGLPAQFIGGPVSLPGDGGLAESSIKLPGQAEVSNTAWSTTLPAISETAHPNLPAEAIIRAWEMSKTLNQAQNSPSNRYVAPK